MAKILIIDDDRDLLQSLQLVLAGKGHHPLAAENPEEGWKALTNQSPELVLLDVMMPYGTEGFHFIWKMRGHQKKSVNSIPVIVISSLHQTTNLRLYPETGDSDYAPGEFMPAQRFLDKPLSPDMLLEVVEAVLEEQRIKVNSA